MTAALAHTHTHPPLTDNRELKQRRRQKTMVLENNNFARASRFFVHFFTAIARLQRENCYFYVSWRTGTQDNDFLYIFLTFDKCFRIQLQKNLPTFDELNKME